MIDVNKEIEHIICHIKDYFVGNGPNSKAVIGISGGKDSTIAAALLVRALGPERVVGVMMPQGEQADIGDSYRVCEALKIPSDNCYEIDIGLTVNSLYSKLGFDKINNQVRTNTPARIRMATLYAIAAMVGGRVINTGNASELYVGYTTKYGDLAGDYAIFKNYYVREVLAIGDALEELPTDLVHKIPADGMSGKTDEDNMGFTYEQVDALCLDDIYPDYETYQKICERHKRNQHKNVINLPAPWPKRGKSDGDFCF